MGPTSSGKTALSLRLAEQFPVEIISVDSAQIYQGMDIGTGKPAIDILRAIPHHLINERDPTDAFSAWQFCMRARECIDDIQKREKIPLLVGGTMMYYQALQQGMTALPASTPEVRQRITMRAQERGWEALFQELSERDPITAERLAPNDRQRIARALEVLAISGRPISQWQLEDKCQALPNKFINFIIWPDTTLRSVLHDHIAFRFDAMLRQGLVDETACLKQREDLHATLPAMRMVGYRQVWEYLENKISYDDMRERAIAATRQLAKRQLTWLRKWPHSIRYDFLDPNNFKAAAKILEDQIPQAVRESPNGLSTIALAH